ncbi:hypothetical protein, partial [Enterobacter asburiae]|uniref:hypothetical protein n=1 Tax=Enterobacter asburiae TaxID=61645 RepID=UPI001C3F85AC
NRISRTIFENRNALIPVPRLSFSEGDCTEYQESAAQSFLICGRLRKRNLWSLPFLQHRF